MMTREEYIAYRDASAIERIQARLPVLIEQGIPLRRKIDKLNRAIDAETQAAHEQGRKPNTVHQEQDKLEAYWKLQRLAADYSAGVDMLRRLGVEVEE